VTLPADVRAKLGIQPGSKIDFRVVGADTAEATVRPDRIGDLFGVVPRGATHLEVEELDGAIGEAVAKRDREAQA
jgi:AbrB family looped-hinge helix DNA binding protein